MHQFKKFPRKSQFEIMGLAIVIILLTLSMVFVVRFVILKGPVEIKKAYTQTELASNMLNTFLDTTSRDCNELSMTDLLEDCAQSLSIYCNGVVSCKYVNDTAAEIFSETLESWNLDYYFSVYEDASNPILTLPEPGNPCVGAKKSKLFPIPIAGGTLYVKLDICG